MDRERLYQYFGGNSVASQISNPFHASCIERIFMSMTPKLFVRPREMEFEATVYFKNGNTEGSHKITGENFGDLFEKTLAFCKSLEL